jgi:hypothetical protein
MEKVMPYERDRRKDTSVLTNYGEVTLRDLQALAQMQELLGDPRKRVEVPQTGPEDKTPPMPASKRYEML